MSRRDVLQETLVRISQDTLSIDGLRRVDGIVNQIGEVRPSMTRPLRDKLAKTLKKGSPVYIWGSEQHGDLLVHSWTMNSLVQRFIESTGLQAKTPKFTTFRRNQMLPKDCLDLTREIFASPVISNYEFPVHEYFKMYALGLVALGIDSKAAEVPEVPLLTRTDKGALSVYDKNKVAAEADRLKSEFGQEERPLLAVVQGGSNQFKRFNNDQVAELVAHAKETNPDRKVIVVSDANITSKPEPVVEDTQIYFPKDINGAAAIFGLTQRVLSTDTLFSHVAAASIAGRVDRAGKLAPKDLIVLHTLGHPDKWGTLGATRVTSRVLYDFWDRGDVSETQRGVIPDTMYKEFWGVDRIHSQDILMVKRAMTNTWR